MTSGPYFDDLHVGQVFDMAPSLTLTSAAAALHQAILGDRLRLPLDAQLCQAVTGTPTPLAHPGLVCDVSIGQSTVVTQRVRANLFYRGLRFFRYPVIGDTLRTTTEVVGMKQNSLKPGREATGLVALRVTTVDQLDRLVLDFHRCAMLPLSADAAHTGFDDDLSAIGSAVSPPSDVTSGWAGAEFRRRVPGPHFDPALAGTVLTSTGDVVSSAPELARLTLNIAVTHHDDRLAGQRLVYGGHTIGLALAQACRLLPNLVTILAWQSCEHTGPVREGDTLYSRLHVESAHAGVLSLRSLVYAAGCAGEPDRPVLDWRFSALQF